MNAIGHIGGRHFSSLDLSGSSAVRQKLQPTEDEKRPGAPAMPASAVVAGSGGTRYLREANPEPAPVYSRPALASVEQLSAGTSAGHRLTAQRMKLRNLLVNDFPDIRAVARQTVEARVQRELGLKIDADSTYFNLFSKTAHLGDKDGIAYQGHPVRSRSLTDVMLYGVDDLGRLSDRVSHHDLEKRSGVYRDGRWATRFGRDNNVAGLTPLVLEKIVKGNEVFTDYPPRLALFWHRNMSTLQILNEADALHFAMTHRRADDRARAIGLDPEEASRLRLSARAIDMLAEASGRPDPDAPRRHTELFTLDINGYASEDILWMRGDDGHVVLFMPDSEQRIREYGSLKEMRADIRRMTGTAAGRKEIAEHFSGYNRRDGSFYQGVDKWLVDIAGGLYDSRIALQSTRFSGNFQDKLGPVEVHSQMLLSDKALGMLSEAAGFPDHAFGAQGTEAFVFDIDTYPSSDMSWLRASDGHVVLIMPGSDCPVHEYGSVDAMRAGIRQMARNREAENELVSHFSTYNRRDGSTYQGVDQWFSDIRGGQYDSYIARSPQSIKGNVFRHQIKRAREADLEQVRYLSQSKANSPEQKRSWITSYGPDNRWLAVPPLSLLEQQEIASGDGKPGRAVRSLGSEFVDACARSWAGLQQWADSVSQRMQAALMRLRLAQAGGATAVTPMLPPAPVPAPAPPAQQPLRPLQQPSDASDNAISTLSSSERRSFVFNDYGFIERTDLGLLYRYEFIPTRRLPVGFEDTRRSPERDGFRPQQTFSAGRRLLAGDVADFYLTPEAAHQAAALNRREGGHYLLYEVDAAGLTGVSLADNRRHNPDVDALMANRGPHTQVRVGGILVPYTMSGFPQLEEAMVQLRLEDEMTEGIVRLT
jgi:hypothetical protein